jgi:hypothetical protein
MESIVRGRTIELFMWGFQTHYNHNLQSLANRVLKRLGIEGRATSLLVGARGPESNRLHPVCVEPEDGQWPLSLFDGLLERIEEIVRSNPLNGMFYSDQRSMQKKPEWTRCASVQEAIEIAFAPFDLKNDVRSFCGSAHLFDGYYVCPVIQIPNSVLGLLTRQQMCRDLSRICRSTTIATGTRSSCNAALISARVLSWPV